MSSEDHISSLSKEGYRLLRERRVEEAEERFSRILAEEPGNSYALVGMGDAARKRRLSGRAIDYYRRCLADDPENTFALFGLADAHRSQRNYRDAVEIWERYLEHDNTNVTVLTRVADGYRKLHNKGRSAELYERVLEIEPDNPCALIGRGHLHYDHNEYEQALKHWKRMMQLSGVRVDIRVLTSIGNCYRKLKQFEEGVPFFEQALKMEEGNFYALFGLADCYRGLNEPVRSLEYWQKILEHDPDNRVILTRAGDTHRTLGELDAAVGCYERALSQADDVFARIGLAIVQRLRGEPYEAISHLEELAGQNPRNSRIAVELAQTYEQLEDHERAATALERFLEEEPGNAYATELLDRYRGSSS